MSIQTVFHYYIFLYFYFRQHDAQEFLRAFVDALHDDVNKIHVKPRYDTDISDHLR